ncbi:ThiF family adenylyltransferase [Methyloceanibacter methanicus]|uniref:ThiF family adenylyltransferase n=1 Tax=Methyloceanibacter methanicus TaxID=1774968 RepID=UPI001FCCC2B9|nr:ThiF family adenylyltransferase [Methyloceanibacter methanicus]
MSKQLINHSPDLQALVDDGYEVEIRQGHLVIHNVPYVNAERKVRRGALVSILDVAGDRTAKPSTHVVMFTGEQPCDKHGRELPQIKHQVKRTAICDDLVSERSFSSKPVGGQGYNDYHEKMTAYAAILERHARAIDANATAQTRRVIESQDADAIFKYIDTASSRAGITAVSKKLALDNVGIIGLGGTGSYVLDLIAKTPVREIHLFDGDDFFQYNAFRSPGAPSVEQLKAVPKKVHYWAARYAPMRNGIIPHDFHIDASNADCLEGMKFVFVCVDRGDAKPPIIEKLEELGIPFIDVEWASTWSMTSWRASSELRQARWISGSTSETRIVSALPAAMPTASIRTTFRSRTSTPSTQHWR